MLLKGSVYANFAAKYLNILKVLPNFDLSFF